MSLNRRLAALAAVTAALAVGPPVASATGPGDPPTGLPFGCLDPNPAWGCGPYGTDISWPTRGPLI
jgi:hypothetical protein